MMEGRWRVTVWGVRGAFPQLDGATQDFGGNTTCLSVETGGGTVILDAGSGLSALGASWKGKRLDILLTHLHLNHVMGLFSFPPVFDPGVAIHLYGRIGFRQALETLIGPPYWPVGFRDFPAAITFHELHPGEAFVAGGVKIDTMEGRHPNGCLYYRLRGADRSLVYALDCALDESLFPALAAFSKGTNLLIWDANFVTDDLHPGWGHSTWEQGLALGRAAGVKEVLMTHYDRTYSSGFLSRQEVLAQQDVKCRFAREGMVIAI